MDMFGGIFYMSEITNENHECHETVTGCEAVEKSRSLSSHCSRNFTVLLYNKLMDKCIGRKVGKRNILLFLSKNNYIRTFQGSNLV